MPHAVAVAVGVLAVGTAVVAVVRQRWALTGLAVGLAGLSALANGVDRPALGDGVNAVVFVAAMVLVAAGAERSGLLAALAGGLVRRVGGHLRLLLATFVGGVAVTTFLNLDTTAVLFTPLALFAAAGSLRVSVDVAARVSSWSAAGLASGGMLLANVGSNLASVLLLEPVATTAALRRGLLIGVNLGAGLTPIGSLATILWRDALRRREADVSWSTFAAFSCPLSIMLVATTLLVAR